MAIDMKFVPRDNLKYSTLASPIPIENSLNLNEIIGDDEKGQMKIIDDLRDSVEKSSPKLNSIFLQKEIEMLHKETMRRDINT